MIDQPVQFDALGSMSEALDKLRERVAAAQVSLGVLKDRAIMDALQEVQPLWTREEISRRCLIVKCVGTEHEQFFVDGVCVLVFEPGEVNQQWHEDRLVVTYTQKFKRVKAVRV